jgi:hypothetical protein
MRGVPVAIVLGVTVVAAFAFGQTVIAANPSSMSGNLLPIHGKPVPTTPRDSGPPGADEIQYDDGHVSGGLFFYDVRARYATRMDPAYYPAVLAQCDFCVRPDIHLLDSIYVQIWFDRDGDRWPDFPAVWSAWARDSQCAPDSAAVTVRVPLGQVIIDSGGFWVGMMCDSVHGGLQAVFIDSAMDYPERQVYYWPARDTWCYSDFEGDWMFRCWTLRGIAHDLSISIGSPGGRICVGDTVSPRAEVLNLGGLFEWWIWMRIEHTCSTDNYVDSCFVRLEEREEIVLTYRTWTPLYPGVYRMQCTADSNDTNWTYFTVLPRTGLGQGQFPLSLTRTGIEVGPNPVRSAATICYYVASESRVELRILDTRGRIVRTLVSGNTAAGEHSVIWDACDDLGHPAARGIYFVRLESRECRETRKVVLTR